MVDQICAMQSVNDFIRVAAELTKNAAREELWDEICRCRAVCVIEDQLDDVRLREYSSQLGKGMFPTEVSSFRRHLSGDGARTVALLHCLQLLAYCNEGIRSPLESMINKWCV